MSLSVFNQKVVSTTTALVQEQINVFNAASNGALVLGSGQVIADFVEQISLGLIANLVTERNPYAPAGTDALLKVLAEQLTNNVNLYGKVGPFVITTGIMEKINRDAATISATIAAQAAQGVIQQYLKSAVGALAAAIGSNSKAVHTQPARVNPNAGGANVLMLMDFPLAAGKFGDAAGMINTWVMDGATWANFTAYQVIPNVEQLFNIGNINVMSDGLGRRFLVTDALSGTAGVQNSVLGLVPAAAVVTTTGLNMEAGTRLGGENIEKLLQGEFSYNLALKGYRLKKTYTDKLDGKTPTKQADMLKASNWETVTGGNVDAAPYSIDQYDEKHDANGDPITGANAPTGTKRRQPAQTVIDQSVKETAGVLIKLTATTPTAVTP